MKHLAIYWDCTARSVLDLDGDPEDRFPRDAAQTFKDRFDGKLDVLFVMDSPKVSIYKIHKLINALYMFSQYTLSLRAFY